jgi:signal transduction histidine kinase
MQLTLATRGEPQSLSGPADLAFYRIVQESLTNATKHAPGSDVRLDIDWSNAEATLTITNSDATAVSRGLVSQGTGHGLNRYAGAGCGGWRHGQRRSHR